MLQRSRATKKDWDELIRKLMSELYALPIFLSVYIPEISDEEVEELGNKGKS